VPRARSDRPFHEEGGEGKGSRGRRRDERLARSSGISRRRRPPGYARARDLPSPCARISARGIGRNEKCKRSVNFIGRLLPPVSPAEILRSPAIPEPVTLFPIFFLFPLSFSLSLFSRCLVIQRASVLMLMSEIFINTLHSVDLFERNEGRFRSTREINKYHELATVHSPREN